MKKTYITPSICIVKIETPELICTSCLDGFNVDTEETTSENYVRGWQIIIDDEE